MVDFLRGVIVISPLTVPLLMYIYLHASDHWLKCTTAKELQKSEESSALQVLVRTRNATHASDHAHKNTLAKVSWTQLTAC